MSSCGDLRPSSRSSPPTQLKKSHVMSASPDMSSLETRRFVDIGDDDDDKRSSGRDSSQLLLLKSANTLPTKTTSTMASESNSEAAALIRKPLQLRRCFSMIECSEFLPETKKFERGGEIFSKLRLKRPAEFSSGEENSSETMDGSSSKRRHIDATSSSSSLSKASLDVTVARSLVVDQSNLTSDGRRQLLLPTVAGMSSNGDLNNIDCHVLADLLNGKFDHQVDAFALKLKTRFN